VFAAPNGSTGMRQAIPGGEHKVLDMYINAGNANEEEISPDVYTTVDQGTIDCVKTTCTLALSAMQETESADESGEWRIVALVDGTAVDGGPFCDDPLEFFGQSYGDMDGGGLYLAIAGSSASWTQKSTASGTSKTTGRVSTAPPAICRRGAG
jgi:predicted ribosomally synthesized peptide with SipW-like signal peptide